MGWVPSGASRRKRDGRPAAVANVASNHVTALDGLASELRDWSSRGALVGDVVLAAAGIAVLLAMVRYTRPAGAGRPAEVQPAPEP